MSSTAMLYTFPLQANGFDYLTKSHAGERKRKNQINHHSVNNIKRNPNLYLFLSLLNQSHILSESYYEANLPGTFTSKISNTQKTQYFFFH